MESRDILKFCLKRGFLVDKEILNVLSEITDKDSLNLLIEKIKTNTSNRIITKEILYENKETVNELFLSLSETKQEIFEKLKIKLGLSIEISREKAFSPLNEQEKVEKGNVDFSGNVEILSNASNYSKKIEVSDFVSYFRNRFSALKDVLQSHSELTNLVSINKISGSRQGISVIGMISEKRVTKNKNILLDIEDLTGKIRVLINKDKIELYEKAEDLVLDSVVGFKCAGNREILFANDIIFPDSMIFERKRSPFEEYALFIGDLHFGSKLFLENNFLNFLNYLKGEVSNTPEVEKIKYLFIVGDLVTGVGNYPKQEKDLKISDLEEQFLKIANLLQQIPKRIKIIISPGNHDGVRLMEPQPLFDEKYAWPLYDLDNVILTENPCLVNIGKNKSFSGFDILTYHGFSYPFYANNVPKLMIKKSMNTPEEIMKFLLKNRHLAPTHASTQYFPLEKDPLFLKDVPDIFVSAHTHKSAISYYNNILLVSTSCWESMTPYQEKFGNEPDHCKVPMFNLKTGAVRILDFE